MADPLEGVAASNGNRRQPPTIYDIATRVGVHSSTVSRALNKPGRINAATERRIRDAAAELGYRGNPMARALPTGRTRTLGLLLSDITNPVYFDFIRGAERISAADGYSLILAESQESAELELETAERMLGAVDGLILVASRLEDSAIAELANRKPVIVVNREIDGVPSVIPSVEPGIHAAIEHLVSLGHRSVAFLSGPSMSWMSRHRWAVIFELARAAGMSVFEIGPSAPTREAGRAGLERVLASGATAVIAYNDLMAIGLLDACHEAAVDVPGRLSIVGFDDIFGADFTSPPLTTIRTPLDGTGEVVAGWLVAKLDHGAPTGLHALATSLVIRRSTASPAL